MKNYLLDYSEKLAVAFAELCKSISGENNICFQIKRSSSSVYANIREANYGQSPADMVAKFEIALKEANETGYWLELLYKTDYIDEQTYKSLDSACASIRVMLISSINTSKTNHTQ